MRIFRLTYSYRCTHAIHTENFLSFKDAYERLEEEVIRTYGRQAKLVEASRSDPGFENEVYYEILDRTGRRVDHYSAIQISSGYLYHSSNAVSDEMYERAYREYRKEQKKDLPYHPKGEVL